MCLGFDNEIGQIYYGLLLLILLYRKELCQMFEIIDSLLLAVVTRLWVTCPTFFKGPYGVAEGWEKVFSGFPGTFPSCFFWLL